MSTILTEPELRRFKNQMQISGIGPEGQLKLKEARIAVIGVGGTGTAALQYLSASGIGNFAIVDEGLVDENNIQRQTLYGGADLGKLKTIITRQRLLDVFPLCTYNIVNLRLNSANAGNILKDYDIIIDTTNNPESAIVINDACILNHKPWVYCFVHGTQIELSVFNFINGPSLRCLSQRTSEISPGTAAIAYGIAGNFIATEIFKMVTGIPGVLSGKLLKFNIPDYSVVFQNIERVEQHFR